MAYGLGVGVVAVGMPFNPHPKKGMPHVLANTSQERFFVSPSLGGSSSPKKGRLFPVFRF